MRREFTDLKAKLRGTLKKIGTYRPEMEYTIEIAAGAGLLYNRLVKDIEALESPIMRDNEDIDAVPSPDEAVKLLPKAAKEYHNALVALGLADNLIEEARPGRPVKSQPQSDNDALDALMRAATGNIEQ